MSNFLNRISSKVELILSQFILSTIGFAEIHIDFLHAGYSWAYVSLYVIVSS